MNLGPKYQIKEIPEFLKGWIRNGNRDLSQLELFIPLPIAEDIFLGFIITVVGFLFGVPMTLGGLAEIFKKFNWGSVALAGIGFFFLGIFCKGIIMLIRSLHLAVLKKEKTVGIWILKTGILIRVVPDMVEYYKWDELEEAVIEKGYVTQTNSPSRHYAIKILRLDFRVNEIYRLRFIGERGNKIVEPTNELINPFAYDVTLLNGSLKKMIKSCEKFISIKKENL